MAHLFHDIPHPPQDTAMRHHRDDRHHDDPFDDGDIQALLYGVDPTPGIVAAEFRPPNRVLLYQRDPETGETRVIERQFRPWLIATDATRWEGFRPGPVVSQLSGNHPLNILVEFETWEQYRRAIQLMPERSQEVYFTNAPISQFLLASGVTLFKEMAFTDLRRMQLDIETLGLDPTVDAAAIIMVAIRQGTHEELLMLDTSEADLIERFVEVFTRLDPDVIEGHNLFNFDIPYIIERAHRHGVPLPLGRDGSVIATSDSVQRFRVGPTSIPYTLAHLHGRHIVDTYQQIQRFDAIGRLPSYGLKNVIRDLGLEREDRVHVQGEAIADMWRSGLRDRERLADYAMDDVRDVDVLARIAVPTEFYQTQILPMTFQRTTITGTGRKIDDLMVRAYLAAGHSLPKAQTPRAYPGGFVELVESGVFGPIVKGDVESLYPSIMLAEQITSVSDSLRAFPLLLRDLTQRRLDAKQRMRTTTGSERALWDGLQSSFKVLINSFYGYLGFGGGLFNDFDAAEKVTLEGQRLIQRVVAELKSAGARPIEVDTDGVYFTPPPGVETEDDEERFVGAIGSHALPASIRLAHDGRYARMLSLKIKTYALLDYDGALTLKGSALRSRKMERIFQRFIDQAARGLLSDQRDAVREEYFRIAEALLTHEVPPSDISQWTMVNARTLESQPRLHTLLRAHPGRWRAGERVEIYERQDGSFGFVEDYAQDENTRTLLRKLHDTAIRFEDAFSSSAEFEAFFPLITPRTRLDVAREMKAVEQLGLF
ncbi:MAG: DNA polymerase domain-containing protein [Thermomicrobiales bacterium]